MAGFFLCELAGHVFKPELARQQSHLLDKGSGGGLLRFDFRQLVKDATVKAQLDHFEQAGKLGRVRQKLESQAWLPR